ncbi:hypothetical protein VTO73DRAFT_2089 [Trametes versicolor]
MPEHCLPNLRHTPKLFADRAGDYISPYIVEHPPFLAHLKLPKGHAVSHRLASGHSSLCSSRPAGFDLVLRPAFTGS